MSSHKVSGLFLLTLVLVLALLMAGLASLALGARVVPLPHVVDALANTLGASHTSNHASTDLAHSVVLERLPRTAFALLAGAALGMSGALMQAVTRNPIADPSILGVNTGAALSVVLGLTFFNLNTPYLYILFALVGAALTSIVVYGLGSLGPSGTTPIKLALAGAATTAALSSVISALVLPRTEVMNAYRFWQIGSISGASWQGLAAMAPFMVLAMAIALRLSSALDAMALGDEMATGLGVKTGWVRLLSTASGILLCATVTALAGPIGFVGLMVPHIMKALVGVSFKRILPYTALGGALLLTTSDVLGRVLGRPSELEVGIITALMGAPILISIVRRTRVKI